MPSRSAALTGLRNGVEEVEEKASKAGINEISWIDEQRPGAHDIALATCLPLARGNTAGKKGRV